MKTNLLVADILQDLDDLKAVDVCALNVKKRSPYMEYMIIATGNSSRHVHSLAENLVQKIKARNTMPIGVERDPLDEWILIDLDSIVIHLMQPQTRSFYNLEELWSTVSNKTNAKNG